MAEFDGQTLSQLERELERVRDRISHLNENYEPETARRIGAKLSQREDLILEAMKDFGGGVMKTPEEMAEEWVKDNYVSGTFYAQDCRDAYLAGYQAAQPQWISVKERLPEENTLVLAYRGGYHIAFRAKDDDWRWLEGHMGWDLDTPTYWMPLPEPPLEK